MSITFWPDVVIGMLGATIVYWLLALRIRREQAEHRAWVDKNIQVSGVIERWSEGRDDEFDTYYKPVIVYTAPDGQRYSIDGESSPFPGDIGSNVMVAYDPAMPSTARLVEGRPAKSTGTADVILFAVLVLIGAVVSAVVRAK